MQRCVDAMIETRHAFDIAAHQSPSIKGEQYAVIALFFEFSDVQRTHARGDRPVDRSRIVAGLKFTQCFKGLAITDAPLHAQTLQIALQGGASGCCALHALQIEIGRAAWREGWDGE